MATDSADANIDAVVRMDSSDGGNAGDTDKNLPNQHTEQSNASGEVQFEGWCKERRGSNTTKKTNSKALAAPVSLSTTKCTKPVAILPKPPEQSVGIESIQPEQRSNPAEKWPSYVLIPVRLTIPTTVESVSVVSDDNSSSQYNRHVLSVYTAVLCDPPVIDDRRREEDQLREWLDRARAAGPRVWKPRACPRTSSSASAVALKRRPSFHRHSKVRRPVPIAARGWPPLTSTLLEPPVPGGAAAAVADAAAAADTDTAAASTPCIQTTALKKHSNNWRCFHCRETFADFNLYQNHVDICERRRDPNDPVVTGARTADTSERCESGMNETSVRRSVEQCPEYRVVQCAYCNRRLSTRSRLARHIRLHTRKLTHKCDTCGCTFARAEKLKLHYKRWHDPLSTLMISVFDSKQTGNEPSVSSSQTSLAASAAKEMSECYRQYESVKDVGDVKPSQPVLVKRECNDTDFETAVGCGEVERLVEPTTDADGGVAAAVFCSGSGASAVAYQTFEDNKRMLVDCKTEQENEPSDREFAGSVSFFSLPSRVTCFSRSIAEQDNETDFEIVSFKVENETDPTDRTEGIADVDSSVLGLVSSSVVATQCETDNEKLISCKIENEANLNDQSEDIADDVEQSVFELISSLVVKKECENGYDFTACEVKNDTAELNNVYTGAADGDSVCSEVKDEDSSDSLTIAVVTGTNLSTTVLESSATNARDGNKLKNCYVLLHRLPAGTDFSSAAVSAFEHSQRKHGCCKPSNGRSINVCVRHQCPVVVDGRQCSWNYAWKASVKDHMIMSHFALPDSRADNGYRLLQDTELLEQVNKVRRRHQYKPFASLAEVTEIRAKVGKVVASRTFNGGPTSDVYKKSSPSGETGATSTAVPVNSEDTPMTLNADKTKATVSCPSSETCAISLMSDTSSNKESPLKTTTSTVSKRTKAKYVKLKDERHHCPVIVNGRQCSWNYALKVSVNDHMIMSHFALPDSRADNGYRLLQDSELLERVNKARRRHQCRLFASLAEVKKFRAKVSEVVDFSDFNSCKNSNVAKKSTAVPTNSMDSKDTPLTLNNGETRANISSPSSETCAISLMSDTSLSKKSPSKTTTSTVSKRTKAKYVKLKDERHHCPVIVNGRQCSWNYALKVSVNDHMIMSHFALPDSRADNGYRLLQDSELLERVNKARRRHQCRPFASLADVRAKYSKIVVSRKFDSCGISDVAENTTPLGETDSNSTDGTTNSMTSQDSPSTLNVSELTAYTSSCSSETCAISSMTETKSNKISTIKTMAAYVSKAKGAKYTKWKGVRHRCPFVINGRHSIWNYASRTSLSDHMIKTHFSLSDSRANNGYRVLQNSEVLEHVNGVLLRHGCKPFASEADTRAKYCKKADPRKCDGGQSSDADKRSSPRKEAASFTTAGDTDSMDVKDSPLTLNVDKTKASTLSPSSKACATGSMSVAKTTSKIAAAKMSTTHKATILPAVSSPCQKNTAACSTSFTKISKKKPTSKATTAKVSKIRESTALSETCSLSPVTNSAKSKSQMKQLTADKVSAVYKASGSSPKVEFVKKVDSLTVSSTSTSQQVLTSPVSADAKRRVLRSTSSRQSRQSIVSTSTAVTSSCVNVSIIQPPGLDQVLEQFGVWLERFSKGPCENCARVTGTCQACVRRVLSDLDEAKFTNG